MEQQNSNFSQVYEPSDGSDASDLVSYLERELNKLAASLANRDTHKTWFPKELHLPAGGGGGGGMSQVAIIDSPTVDMQGNGTTNSPLGANVIVSNDTGNALTTRSNGLYATLPTFSLSTADTTTVELAGQGIAGNPLKGTVKVSGGTTNLLKVNMVGGLAVTNSSDVDNMTIRDTDGNLKTPLYKQSGTSIALSGEGTYGNPLKSSLSLAGVAGNLLSVTNGVSAVLNIINTNHATPVYLQGDGTSNNPLYANLRLKSGGGLKVTAEDELMLEANSDIGYVEQITYHQEEIYPPGESKNQITWLKLVEVSDDAQITNQGFSFLVSGLRDGRGLASSAFAQEPNTILVNGSNTGGFEGIGAMRLGRRLNNVELWVFHDEDHHTFSLYGGGMTNLANTSISILAQNGNIAWNKEAKYNVYGGRTNQAISEIPWVSGGAYGFIDNINSLTLDQEGRGAATIPVLVYNYVSPGESMAEDSAVWYVDYHDGQWKALPTSSPIKYIGASKQHFALRANTTPFFWSEDAIDMVDYNYGDSSYFMRRVENLSWQGSLRGVAVWDEQVWIFCTDQGIGTYNTTTLEWTLLYQSANCQKLDIIYVPDPTEPRRQTPFVIWNETQIGNSAVMVHNMQFGATAQALDGYPAYSDILPNGSGVVACQGGVIQLYSADTTHITSTEYLCGFSGLGEFIPFQETGIRNYVVSQAGLFGYDEVQQMWIYIDVTVGPNHFSEFYSGLGNPESGTLLLSGPEGVFGLIGGIGQATELPSVNIFYQGHFISDLHQGVVGYQGSLRGVDAIVTTDDENPTTWGWSRLTLQPSAPELAQRADALEAEVNELNTELAAIEPMVTTIVNRFVGNRVVQGPVGLSSPTMGTKYYTHYYIESRTAEIPVITRVGSASMDTDQSRDEIFMTATNTTTTQGIAPTFVFKYGALGWEVKTVTFFLYRQASNVTMDARVCAPPGASSVTNVLQASWPSPTSGERCFLLGSYAPAAQGGSMGLGAPDNGSANQQCQIVNFSL